jgi:hypothetical protein
MRLRGARVAVAAACSVCMKRRLGPEQTGADPLLHVAVVIGGDIQRSGPAGVIRAGETLVTIAGARGAAHRRAGGRL